MLSQPTLHEMRAQRRHQARLRAFEVMKEDMKEFVATEVRDVVYQTLYGEQGKLLTPIISEIMVRAGLSEKAGRGFSHSHPAKKIYVYPWPFWLKPKAAGSVSQHYSDNETLGQMGRCSKLDGGHGYER